MGRTQKRKKRDFASQFHSDTPCGGVTLMILKCYMVHSALKGRAARRSSQPHYSQTVEGLLRDLNDTTRCKPQKSSGSLVSSSDGNIRPSAWPCRGRKLPGVDARKRVDMLRGRHYTCQTSRFRLIAHFSWPLILRLFISMADPTVGSPRQQPDDRAGRHFSPTHQAAAASCRIAASFLAGDFIPTAEVLTLARNLNLYKSCSCRRGSLRWPSFVMELPLPRSRQLAVNNSRLQPGLA